MLESRKICTLEVELADPYVISHHGGQRRFISIAGGRVTGDHLRGEILPVGEDLQWVRPDGVVELDIRALLRIESGSLVYLSGTGFRHGPPDVLQRIAAGDVVAATEYYFRECLVFETDDPQLDWLTKAITIGKGHRLKNSARIEVFEVK
ncbi:DUF3237 domain-containing protein [Mycolicibacterium frederiksbergense]|nr:DUF3237 domain-containing protein [Mycolicibacterium frederiksbergense]